MQSEDADPVIRKMLFPQFQRDRVKTVSVERFTRAPIPMALQKFFCRVEASRKEQVFNATQDTELRICFSFLNYI